jgi:hypothetical protein
VCKSTRDGELNATLICKTYIVDKEAAQEWARRFNRRGKMKRGPKPRPYEYCTVGFYIPNRFSDWLHAKAQAENVSMSYIVNGLLQAEYEKEVR